MSINASSVNHESLMIQMDRAIQLDLPAMIWGEPGIGKSSVVEQIAKIRGMKCISIHMSQLGPGDLWGLQFPDSATGKTKQFPPEMLPTPEDDPTVVFFDEYGAAQEAVRKPSTQLILEKRLGSFVLDPKHRCCAASNTGDDGTLTYSLDRATADRFLHLRLVPEYDYWKNTYAKAASIDPRIIRFLDLHTQFFCASKFEESNRNSKKTVMNIDEIVPTPRSWARISRIIQGVDDIDRFEPLVCGSVGPGAASQFCSFSKVNEHFKSVRELIEAKPDARENMLPKKEASVLTLATSLAPNCNSLEDSIHTLHIAGLISKMENLKSRGKKQTFHKFNPAEVAAYAVDMICGRILSRHGEDPDAKKRGIKDLNIAKDHELTQTAFEVYSGDFFKEEGDPENPVEKMMQAIQDNDGNSAISDLNAALKEAA